MATDIVYANCTWEPQNEIRGFIDNKALIAWALRYISLQGNWIVLRPFSLSKAELRTLSDVLPEVGVLNHDFQSALVIFFHLGKLHRFSPDQIAELDAAISAKAENMEALLRSYFPDSTNEPVYKVFTLWADLGFHSWKFLMNKCHWATQIVLRFSPFKTCVDNLLPALNGLVLGTKTKPECQVLGAAAVQLQEVCYEAVESYFSIPMPEHFLGDSVQVFLRTFLEDVVVLEDFSILTIKNRTRRSNLHLNCSVDQPDSLRSWEEFGSVSRDLNAFFGEIRGTIIDPITSAMSKIPSKLAEVTTMRAKVHDSLEDPDVTYESISLLHTDLAELFKSLCTMSDLGVLFQVDTLGVDREEFSSWRLKILTKYTVMKKVRDEKENISKALQDTYQKSTKIRKLPDVTQATWARFLFIWKTESLHYSTDLQRLGVLRSHLIDAVDKHSTEHISTLQEMLAYLYRRYGTESTVFQSMLTEILHLPFPRDDKQEEVNLAKISAITSISTNHENTLLYTMEKMKAIVNTTLKEKTKENFYDRFLDCKLTLRGSTPPEEWDQVYERDYSQHRLDFLNAFINRRLEVLRAIAPTKAVSKYSSPKGSKDVSKEASRVTDPNEKWSCPLCSCAHRDQKFSFRPYLSVCAKFLDMSIRDRNGTCDKLKYCKLCTRDAAKYHKGASICPLVDMFACSICSGDKALTHCLLLCYSSDSTPRSRLGKGQFSRDPPQDGSRDSGRRGAGRGRGRPQGNGGRGRRSSARQDNPPPGQADAFPTIRHFSLQDIVRKFDATNFLKTRNVPHPAISVLSLKDQGPPHKDGDPVDGSNDAPMDPPLGGQGSLSSTQSPSKTHCVDHNLKTIKQLFGNSKMSQISPVRIMFILKLSLFAHTQLSLPLFSPILPECSYDPEKSYFFNGLSEASSKTQQVQWPLDPYDPRLTVLSADGPEDSQPHSTDCETAVPVQWPAHSSSHQTGSSDDQERSGPSSPVNLYSLYSLKSTDWPSDPLVSLICRKKAGRKVESIPNLPKIKINNIYQLQDLTSIEDSDPRDLRILKYNLCSECEERARKCSKCKNDSKQSTLEEIAEFKMIAESVEPIVIDGQRFLKCNYPVMGNAPTLYHQDLSNRQSALAKSKSLFRKLHKLGLAADFDAEVMKSHEEKHIKFLSQEEEKDFLQSWHCFAGLTYAIKASSSTQKIRPCTDSSLPHKSGSLNSKLPLGINKLNDMRAILIKFRLNPHAIAADLHRAYRSMFACWTGSRLRATYYPQDPLDPNCDAWRIFVYLRVSYGDSLASCLLEILCRDWIAQDCETDAGALLLRLERYVDDILSSNSNKQELWGAISDMKQALGKNGFKVKQVYSSKNWHLAFDKTSSASDYDPSKPEVIFHHAWMWSDDTLSIIPNLNTYKKCRGAPGGPNLTEMDITSIQVTRRVGSRLVGEMYDPTGAFTSPLTGCFKIFYSQICMNTQGWDDQPVDQELVQNFKDFLLVIKETLHQLKPWPRCFRPDGYSYRKLVLHHDGSVAMASYALYLVSAPIGEELTLENGYSLLVQACNSLKHHSVPLIETSSGLLGVEAMTTLIISHPDIIQDNFICQVESDSECHLWWMNPSFIHKSVLARNLCRSIHLLLRDLSLGFPTVKITYSHVRTLLNCADANSKVIDNPITVINSQEWRHGHAYFMDMNMPAKDDVYLSVMNGTPSWTPPSSPTEHTCLACSTPCPCLPCTWSTVDAGSEIAHRLTQVGSEHLIQKSMWPLVSSRAQSNFKSPPWELALSNLPTLSENFFHNTLTRNSLVNTVRSISRVLKTVMCPDLLKEFGVKENFVATQRSGELNASDRRVISNLEMSPAFKKLSFLALVRWSTTMYPPATSKTTNLYFIAQIPFVVTRYSAPAMEAVYGSLLLPYISSHHVALQYRLFEHSHICHSPAHPSSLGVFHLPLTSTLQGCRSGDFASISSHQRKTISTFINKCAFCILKSNSQRNYSHTPGDPRMLDFLNSEDLPFHTVSIDLLSEVWVRHHSKSRGKPSHTVTILIALDLATGAICLTVASDSKTPAVVKALKSLGLRYRFPKKIISDAGSSLSNLASHPELIAELTHQNVEFIPVGQGEQFSNSVERQIGECKKILSSLKEDPLASIYAQPNTLEELMGKLLSVEAAMNARPILISNKDSTTMIITPKMILSPYLTPTQLESWVLDILQPFAALSTLANLVTKNHQAVLSALQVSILDYLQCQGIKYQTREGNDSKADLHDLQPAIDDVVLYKTSDGRKFGIITGILEKNMIEVRTTYYGSVTIRVKHVRLLTLIHRKSEWNPATGLPVSM